MVIITQNAALVHNFFHFFEYLISFRIFCAYNGNSTLKKARLERLMQINRKTLDGLLGLSDDQLMALVGSLAKNSGVDLGQFKIDATDVQSVRRALSSVTDDEIRAIVEQYRNSHSGGRR